MSEFRTVRYRASVFETRLTRWLRNLAVQFAPSTILSVRRLSFPPLSSLLLYIEAVMITLLVLQEPIRAFWYGTPLGGDRSLLAIYDSYIYTPGFLWYGASLPRKLSNRILTLAVRFLSKQHGETTCFRSTSC